VPDTFRYDIPDDARKRILFALKEYVDRPPDGFTALLDEVGEQLLKQYGGLCQPSYIVLSQSDNPVIEHLLCCDDEMTLDFIELCFRASSYIGKNEGVDQVNEILREMAIGYELTPWTEHVVEREGSLFGRRRKARFLEIEYPEFIRKDNQYAHQEIVRPCLNVLSSRRFTVANSEMLKALENIRHGRYSAAITSCNSAFESVLKTICDHKGWKYDKRKDSCAKLISICKDSGLFPPFYAPIFESTCIVRNKLGDAHGRGPNPDHTADQTHAEHVIRMTAAHVLLLSNLAELH